jgi:hypothetical protein
VVRSVCIRYRTCTSLAVVWCSCNTVVHVRVIVIVTFIVIILLVSCGSLRSFVGSVMARPRTMAGEKREQGGVEGGLGGSVKERGEHERARLHVCGRLYAV